MKIRKADSYDMDICVETLTMAFNDDPVINWFIRQDHQRGKAFELFFKTAFEKLTLPHGEVYTSERGKGVALWTPPGKWKLGLLDQLKLVPDYTRAFKPTRLHKVFPSIQKMQNLHPMFPHYYLFVAGVLPFSQGLGIGSALLRTVLSRCDEENLPAYLEATTERNRDLYHRHGFRVIKQFFLAEGGPCMWFMLRQPRQERIREYQ